MTMCVECNGPCPGGVQRTRRKFCDNCKAATRRRYFDSERCREMKRAWDRRLKEQDLERWAAMDRARGKRYRATQHGRAVYNAGKVRSQRRRRARKHGAFVGTDDVSWTGHCYLCREPLDRCDAHLEHKIPLSRGGAHDIDNLDWACAPCNLSKGTRTHYELLFEEN